MSYLFNSTTDRLIGGTGAIPFTGSMTAWFKVNWEDDAADHLVFGDDSGGGSSFRLQRFTDNTFYLGWLQNSSVTDRVVVGTTNYDIVTGAWNSIALTWDDVANQSIGYLNGLAIGTPTSTLIPHTTTGARTIGNYTSGAGDVNFDGLIAEVALRNTVLTPAQVGQFHAGIPADKVGTGLLNYWKLASEAGGVTPDSAGSDPMTNSGATLTADNPPIIGTLRRKRGGIAPRAVGRRLRA